MQEVLKFAFIIVAAKVDLPPIDRFSDVQEALASAKNILQARP
jgi:hypothetical protein